MILAGNVPVKPFPYRTKSAAIDLWFMRELDKLHQCIKINGLPDTIPERDLKNQLLVGGWSVITDAPGDLYAFHGTFGGVLDPYYNPTETIIVNPWLNFEKKLKIGTDCELIRNDTMMIGIAGTLMRYGQAIVENEITMNLLGLQIRGINKIISTLKSSKATADEYYKKLEDGELSAILDKAFVKSMVSENTPVAQGTLTQMVEVDRYWRATYSREFGINENYNSKRESISAGEAEMNDDPLTVLISNIKDNWTDGFDRVNKKYGTNISCELAGPWALHEKEVQAKVDLIYDQATADGELNGKEVETDGQKETP